LQPGRQRPDHDTLNLIRIAAKAAHAILRERDQAAVRIQRMNTVAPQLRVARREVALAMGVEPFKAVEVPAAVRAMKGARGRAGHSAPPAMSSSAQNDRWRRSGKPWKIVSFAAPRRSGATPARSRPASA
jgi:hypothetical protein